jgi:hypothetical protein
MDVEVLDLQHQETTRRETAKQELEVEAEEAEVEPELVVKVCFPLLLSAIDFQ